MFTTVKGSLVNFTYAVGRPLPNMYVPRGYGVERGLVTWRGGETLYYFTMLRGMDQTVVQFSFHVPDDQRQRAYWLVDGSDKKIPSTHMSKLINRIQSVMTRQKKVRQGFGYYL